MVCPTQDACDGDVMNISLPDRDKVHQVHCLDLGCLHPFGFAFVCLMEDGVGDAQLVLRAQKEEPFMF